MMDASSSATASPAIQPIKATAASIDGPDATASIAVANSHVQAWMQALKASTQTADAILNLPMGGLKPVD